MKAALAKGALEGFGAPIGAKKGAKEVKLAGDRRDRYFKLV